MPTAPRRLLALSSLAAMLGIRTAAAPAAAAEPASPFPLPPGGGYGIYRGLAAGDWHVTPKRISCLPWHHFYDEEAARTHVVLFNGEVMPNVETADASAGWVQLRPPARARYGGPSRQDMIFGDVRIVRVEDAPPAPPREHPWPFQPRLSALPYHPWGDDHWSQSVRVHLDGQEIRGVITLDAVEGWVERHPPGYPASPDGDHLAVEKVWGRVQVFDRATDALLADSLAMVVARDIVAFAQETTYGTDPAPGAPVALRFTRRHVPRG